MEFQLVTIFLTIIILLLLTIIVSKEVIPWYNAVPKQFTFSAVTETEHPHFTSLQFKHTLSDKQPQLTSLSYHLCSSSNLFPLSFQS